MSYNLQSLITTLQQILNPEQTRWILDDHNKPQLESLLKKSSSLQQILENSSDLRVESLEGQIREASYEAEDIIESHIVDQVLLMPGCVSCNFSTPDLQQVIEEFDSAMKQLVLKEESKISIARSSEFLPDLGLASKNVVVGVDEDLMRLKDRLTRMQSKLEIVPIVGMGGIGKTTLARELYDDPLIVYHFETRAWTTISQHYNLRAILLGLLDCINGKPGCGVVDQKEDELKEILHKSLYGRRYLIVLDDMWSNKSWEAIKMYFPDCNNGSRIVVTTRETDVARCVGKQSLLYQVQLLNKSESWNLLHQVVFGEEDCSDALEGIGRKIASDCGGLPLAINVIGGILTNAERSSKVWELIANDVRAAIFETDEQFSNILSLSYNHLPNHLRPCFLYMGAFPEDQKIKGSKLIRLWVAEGFVKSNGDKGLEEEAEDYLKALVERNLVMVRDKKGNGKPKSYNIHDLLRDVCMRKGVEEKFAVHVKNGADVRLCKPRRVSVDTSCGMEDVYASAELMSLARSFLCTGVMSRGTEALSRVFFALRLVRVLDVLEMQFQEFPREILQLVNLRYLAFSIKVGGIPCGISRLWNLQTLIAKVEVQDAVPSEIWEMPELRHLKLNTIVDIKEEEMQSVKKKLQTILLLMIPFVSSRDFFESIPNIEKLGICCLMLPSGAVDLSYLHKLQKLTCSSLLNEEGCLFLPTLRFPCSLRKLSLFECVIFGSFTTTLCALPNLEVLKIWNCSFHNEDEEGREEEWEVLEGDEFQSLQFLQLQELKLVHWRADETNFPRLQQLRIGCLYELEEIPSGIGDIPTLQLIDLYKCSPSAVASAKQMHDN